MRFIHLADLHLGRSLAEFSLIELQKEILGQIIDYIRNNDVDAVVIAGDVYDRAAPSTQAVNLLDGFLTLLSQLGKPVLLIAGNHDSPERLSFLSPLLERSGVYIAGDYRLGQPPVTLTDAFGPVNFYLLPFFRPGYIRAQAGGEIIGSYDDAVRCAVRHMNVNASERNVLVAHQFVCASGSMPLRSDSEMIFVGGTELVSAESVGGFDYVALGHLHQAQRVGGEFVRYAGAPLKYALGESASLKSFAVVDLYSKGETRVQLVPIRPSIDLRMERGKLEELLDRPVSDRDGDFIEVRLTDEQPVFDAMQRLRARYPRVVSVRREGDMHVSHPSGPLSASRRIRRDPMSVFERFYEEAAGQPLSPEETEDVKSALAEAREEENA